MRLVAIFALHIHFKMQVVFTDLRDIAVAPQAFLAFGFNLARCMRLVALVAIELHRGLIAILNLDGLINDLLFRLEITDIHSPVGNELLSDVLIGAVTVEAFLPARSDILGAICMTVDAGESAHALTMHLFPLVAFIAEFFRGEEVMKAALVRLNLSMALGTLNLLHIDMLGMEQRFVDFLARSFSMTFVAYFLAYNDFSMPLRN